MKIYFLIILLSALFPAGIFAQGNLFKETFRQKSTQREYLLQQIAALKIYSGYLKQGYNIYKSGHDAISGFKQGTFDLHQDYFLSLQKVNPEIIRYARVSDILNIQKGILAIYKNAQQDIRNDERIRADEIMYIDRVYIRLLEDCSQLIQELLDLVTFGKLEMADDERLQSIELLYEEIKDKYRFAETFSGDIRVLSKSRQHEQSGIRTLERMIR